MGREVLMWVPLSLLAGCPSVRDMCTAFGSPAEEHRACVCKVPSSVPSTTCA